MLLPNLNYRSNIWRISIRSDAVSYAKPLTASLAVGTDPLSLILLSNGSEISLPALWVRERTQDPSQLDHCSQQRLFNPHALPIDLSFQSIVETDTGVFIRFSDSHEECFDKKWLLDAACYQTSRPSQKPWNSAHSIHRVAWQALDKRQVVVETLDRYFVDGFFLLTQAPTNRQSILEVAETFGKVRETNFGQVFEVVSREGSEDLAYRNVALDLHTDNPYRADPPGIQLLHCLVNDARGGETTLVDSLAVCEALRRIDPDGFNLLTQLAVRFRYVDDCYDIESEKPLIALDAIGNVKGLYYSPRLDFLPLASESVLQMFHRARKGLAMLLADPSYKLSFRLRPGDVLIFDNLRLLHGREAFDPSDGQRHLQGCYIDPDELISEHKRLRRQMMAEPGY